MSPTSAIPPRPQCSELSGASLALKGNDSLYYICLFGAVYFSEVRGRYRK